MKRAAAFLFKGLSYFLCFIIVSSAILHLLGVKTDLEWSAGTDEKKIISVAGDGSGNTDITIGGKNISVKQSDIKSFAGRLSDILK